jgi:aminoglycoside phosphotransferase (APT) family kinase protein
MEEVRRLAGPAAAIRSVVPLAGGQHAATWRVDTTMPARSVVVRQFPFGDSAAGREEYVLRLLNGLEGLTPMPLASDLAGRWSEQPTLIIGWLEGEADITPSDADAWATQLGRALATLHATPSDRMSGLPSVFDRGDGSPEALAGPLAAELRSKWRRLTAPPDVLTHCDYWSGNVVWRDGVLTGVVDWAGAARGPRGYDLGWCRLDLFLLFDERIADVLLAAYEAASGHTVSEIALWDGWAVARSHDAVETWAPNYQPLGRADLDGAQLRRRHSEWADRVVDSLERI